MSRPGATPGEVVNDPVPSAAEQTAQRIVEAIIADLHDRSGFGDEWDYFDDDIKAEIRATWSKLVLKELQ